MNFLPVYKRELRSYFTSPIAYVLLLFFILLTSFFFTVFVSEFSAASVSGPQQYGPRELNVTLHVLRPLFGNISVILLFMMPLITMKPYSEERKTGTIELLLTYPLSDLEIMLGKFFACFTLLLVMMALTLVYPLFLVLYSQPELGTLASGYLGLILMAASFIALGLFISSLTENQIIAAVATFAILLLFWILRWVGASELLAYLSVLEHFNNFSQGLIDTRDVVYYLSFTVLWLFMTLRVLESKKWRS